MLKRLSCLLAFSAMLGYGFWAFAVPPPVNDDVVGGEAEDVYIEPPPPGPANNCDCNISNESSGSSDCPTGKTCQNYNCTAVNNACNGNRACNGLCKPKRTYVDRGSFDRIFGGAGCQGGDANAIEPPNNTFGNNTLVTAFHQADDFHVPQGETWTLAEGLTWLYQTNSGVNEPIRTIHVQVWRGNPMQGGVLIAGDMTTNRLLDQSRFSGMYRTSDTDRGSCARALKQVSFDLSFVPPLPTGEYWLEIGSTGNPNFSGPWMPVRTLNEATDNSIFYDVANNAWAQFVDAGSGRLADRPFVLYGYPDPCAEAGCTGSNPCLFKKLVCKNGGAKLISKGSGTIGDSVCVQDSNGNVVGCAVVNSRGKWKNVELNVGGGSHTRQACGSAKTIGC